MSKSISIIRKNTCFLTENTVQIHTVWSNAWKHELNKNQLVQNRAARLALHCSLRESVEGMHARLSWLRVEERLACYLVQFIRNIFISKEPAYFTPSL